MKTSCIVVLLLVGAFGLVHSRVASGVSVVYSGGNEVAPACRVEAIPNTTFNVPFILLNKQYECYKPSSVFLGKVSTAADTDAYRTVFRSACTQEAAVRSCIADVTVEASSCLDEMETKMFGTVRDFVEASISGMCDNGSEVIARLYGDEVKPLGLNNHLRVLRCVNGMKAKTSYHLETDLPAYTLRRYRAMKEGRRCIMDVVRNAQRSGEGFDRFLGPLLDTSKCIDAATHEVVLCKTLDP